jgi:REP element-mobilizing transposase RayT
MPRQPRLDAPGLVHHVWAKGIDGRNIFLDDSDRHDLLDRLERIAPESGVPCFAWTLMSNHLHMVLRSGHVPLSTVMKRLHTGFAIRFNRRHERHGYLFQGRFGSRLIRDESDLLTVIAYVLRNPLAAGIVRSLAELERYPWSNYGALIGTREPLAFECVSSTLQAFADEPELARERLRDWVSRKPTSPMSDTRPSLDEVIRETCREHAVAESDLRGGRRAPAVVRARDQLCRRAVHELGFRASDVSRALGLTRGAISHALRRAPRL